MPVKYGSILEQTYFDSFYKEENTRTYLDNLNLLYVALTRAEHGLIITAPHPSVRNAKDSVASLLFSSIQQSDILKNSWNETEMRWTTGSWQILPNEKKKASDGITLNDYLSFEWRNKLVIRQTGKDYFRATEPEYKTKINYGLHIHEVLSRMKYAADVDSTLDKIVFEGLITEVERIELKVELSALLNIPEVASWFARSWEVQTEVPILLPQGGESRLDRLIISDKKAIVIDFKTGEQKKGDNKQVLEYISILRKMNFVDVKGFLLYLRNREVVEVRDSGSPKVVKKSKDENQLSLGW